MTVTHFDLTHSEIIVFTYMPCAEKTRRLNSPEFTTFHRNLQFLMKLHERLIKTTKFRHKAAKFHEKSQNFRNNHKIPAKWASWATLPMWQTPIIFLTTVEKGYIGETRVTEQRVFGPPTYSFYIFTQFNYTTCFMHLL